LELGKDASIHSKEGLIEKYIFGFATGRIQHEIGTAPAQLLGRLIDQIPLAHFRANVDSYSFPGLRVLHTHLVYIIVYNIATQLWCAALALTARHGTTLGFPSAVRLRWPHLTHGKASGYRGVKRELSQYYDRRKESAVLLRLRRDLERDYSTALKAENSQTRTKIVALAAAIWKDYKVVAALLDALDIADRAFGAVPRCDVVVEVDQIAQRFRLNSIL
jgi:hypothetical protein